MRRIANLIASLCILRIEIVGTSFSCDCFKPNSTTELTEARRYTEKIKCCGLWVTGYELTLATSHFPEA